MYNVKVFITGKRSGYAPEPGSCGETLTVKELIEALQECDEDAPVYLKNDNGYTFGNITSWDIDQVDDYDGEEA